MYLEHVMRNGMSVDVKKQNIVSELCDLAEKSPIIKRMIIFGSAAEKKCTDDSDIDICYDLTCNTQDKRARDLSVATSKICDYNCDVVYYDLIGTNLKNEIDTKGIVVYES